MKTRRFTVHVTQDEDGWLVATVEGKPGVHTQAKSLAQLEKRILEAIQLHEEQTPTPKGRGKKAGSKVFDASHRRVEGTFRIEVPA